MIVRFAVADRNPFNGNTASIRKRIEVFEKTTFEVVDHFRGRNKLHSVNSDQAPRVILLELEAILDGFVRKRTGAFWDVRKKMPALGLQRVITGLVNWIEKQYLRHPTARYQEKALEKSVKRIRTSIPPR
jgi:hypothetical protein